MLTPFELKHKYRYRVRTADGKDLGKFRSKDAINNDEQLRELQKLYKDKFIVEKL